jgi:hypothetical protein
LNFTTTVVNSNSLPANLTERRFHESARAKSCNGADGPSVLIMALRTSLAKSPNTQARLFADHLFRLTDAKFPAQVADVEAAHHLLVRIQIV